MKARSKEPTIGTRHIVALVTASLLLAAPSIHAEMKTIVAENFGGSGSALNGKAADTFANGITISGGSSTWRAGTNFLDNGTVLSVSSSLGRCASLNLGTYINSVKGTADGYFELTLTISPTVGAGWISLGFAQENTVNTNKNFTDSPTGTGTTTGNATILYRGSTAAAAYKLDMYGGTKNANAVAGGPVVSGSQTLTVVLDQTPGGGYDGVSNFGKVTWKTNGVAIGTYTYTTTRTFGSILVSQASGNSGTNSTLTLAQTNTTVPSGTLISVKTNNTDDLNLTTSWVGGKSPFNTTNIAKWDSTVQSANTVLLGADTFWGGINISNPVGTVTINAGNTLTLGNEPVDIDMSQATADLTLNCAVALGANNVWDVTNSRTLTVGGAVSGSFDLTKQNLGAAILTAANSHTGTNSIIGGTLTLSGLGSLGNPANNLTLGGGGLDLGGSSQTVGEVSISGARASGQTITNGNLTGTSYDASNLGGNAIISANLLANGSAGFTKSGAGGTVTLLGNNTYTGTTIISGGAINIQTINGLGTTAGGTTVSNGATLQLQGGLTFAAEPLIVGSGSSTTPVLQSVSGDNTWTGTIDTFGALTYARISSDTNLLTLPNTITGSDAATLVILQGAGNILVSGKITGPSGLLLSALGAGTRTLSNPANDFSGIVTLNGGTLRLGAGEVIPDGTGKGNVAFGAIATFDLSGYSETINGLSSTVNGIVDNTATNTTSTLTVGNNDQTTSYNGVIRNTGGTLALTKIGLGTLILTGTNTYTGNTIVKAGILELGVASIAANSTVSVTNDAALQLDFADTNTVAGFITNGVSLPVGVYSAANVFPFIYGAGSLEVAPPQPVIAPVTVSGTNLVVSVVTVSPYNYVLQSTTNLTPTIIWKSESTNAGTGGNLILDVPMEPGKPQKFLRFWVY